MYLSGEIIFVPFPFTNLSNIKKRPALIISNDLVNTTNDVIAVQITSNIHNDEFSFKIKNNMLSEPLQFESEIRCHKIFTLSNSLIVRKISALESAYLRDIIKKIEKFIN